MTSGLLAEMSCTETHKGWDSDDSLKWEDFFGAPTDISSSLLNMFDLIAANNKTEEKSIEQTTTTTITTCPPRIHVLEITDERNKKRPLSASSMSSSSSSSSLPRSGPESKKFSYLASIESLDDELSEDGRSFADKDSNQNLQNLSQTDRVILEIVDSERMYVRDLHIIIEGYLKHIYEQKKIKISKECLKDLFSNIEDIYRFNSSFLDDLELCGLEAVAVARCFVKNSFGFAVYTQYCTNYPRTVSVLTELMGNTETAEIFKERQTTLHHILPLGSYLLKPVQRILKYHLLLENIVKYSNKDSEGYPDIKNALSVMTGIAFHINDMKKKHENAIRVQEIQSLLYSWEGEDLTTYGELVAEGAFRMFHAKALRHLFLFEKMLLITKKKEEGILCYKTHIMCSNLMLIESIQGEPLCFHVIPFDNPRYQYTFQARNVEQKREWCLQLKRVILENYNVVIPLHARQLVMELGQGRQNDDVQIEKSSSKKQLSAPEYLEKRKQERRKSESSLKAFKIKKGGKKTESIGTPKASPSPETRGRKIRNGTHDNSANNGLPIPTSSGRWRRASVDVLPTSRIYPLDEQKQALVQSVCQSTKPEKYLGLPFMPSRTSGTRSKEAKLRKKQPKPCSFGDIPGKIRDEPQSPVKSKERQLKPMWKLLKNFTEETTDTENEDYAELKDYSSFQADTTAVPSDEEFFEDASGEYVTFYFANSHAWRNSSAHGKKFHSGETSTQREMEQKYTYPSSTKWKVISDSNKSEYSLAEYDKLSANYDNLMDLWARLGTVDIKEFSKNNTSLSGTIDSGTLRRTKSFTDTIQPKCSSLHHTMSFRQSTQRDEWYKSPFPYKEDNTFTDSESSRSPRQLELFKDKCATPSCLSLNFIPMLNSDSFANKSNNEDRINLHADHCRSEECSQSVPLLQSSVSLVDDKSLQMDFVGDLERYMERTVSKKHLFNFPVDDPDIATSCSNTPATSTENLHHPDHRIYKENITKCKLFNGQFSSSASSEKMERMPVALQSAEGDDDEYCLLSYDYVLQPTIQQTSCNPEDTSLKTENEHQPKVHTNKLINSLAKAYANVVKQKVKRDKNIRSISPNPLWNAATMPLSYSNILGARIAQPCEAIYCVPQMINSSDSTKHNYEKLLPTEKEMKDFRNDLRPDSVLSESSNTTSSSDGEKLTQTKGGRNILFTISPSEANNKTTAFERDDIPSDMSDASGDSCYERTFEAFENGLNEDIFRDSAIYSDQEDSDVGIIESYTKDEKETHLVSPISLNIPYQHLSTCEPCCHSKSNNETNSLSLLNCIPPPNSLQQTKYIEIYDVPVRRETKPDNCLYSEEDDTKVREILLELESIDEVEIAKLLSVEKTSKDSAAEDFPHINHTENDKICKNVTMPSLETKDDVKSNYNEAKVQDQYLHKKLYVEERHDHASMPSSTYVPQEQTNIEYLTANQTCNTEKNLNRQLQKETQNIKKYEEAITELLPLQCVTLNANEDSLLTSNISVVNSSVNSFSISKHVHCANTVSPSEIKSVSLEHQWQSICVTEETKKSSHQQTIEEVSSALNLINDKLLSTPNEAEHTHHRTIKDRLRSLEENTKFQRNGTTNLSMDGLKSVRQRCKELEVSKCKPKNYKDTNLNSIYQESEQSPGKAESDEQPKFKGWVKHVINKLES